METLNTDEKVNLNSLFSPFSLGSKTLKHRVVLAPLTRMRTTTKNFIPNDLMVEYYTQRATDGGLLITEGTVVSEDGHGYYGAPGIYTKEQVVGWKKIVDAVHKKGSIIYLQIFHVGRQSHIDLQPNRGLPIGPSVVEHQDKTYTPTGWQSTSLNREMDIEDIKRVIGDFRRGAELAKQAGFDGIELHGANGYIIDQFLQDGANKRTDAYGGSIENRSRFLLEIVKAVTDVWGSGHVGVRLAPSGTFGSMSDSNPTALFGYVAKELNSFGLAYLHIIEPRIEGSFEIEEHTNEPIASQYLRKIFTGIIISAGGFTGTTANEIIAAGTADLVAFGRFFISNPDLPFRLKNNLPLAHYNRDTFYGGDYQGYSDYPATDKLFTPIKLGKIELLHRIVHAPMTRLRAEEDASPSEMMVEYYGQRSSEGGLIITESSHPSPESFGYLGAPGIYTDAHVAAWKKITKAVHDKGGKIIMQIAHDGRQSHVSLSGGKLPVAPSVVPFETVSFTKEGWVSASIHRALEIEEIQIIVAEFKKAAERALEAGFDGVELHNANGYFVDTFLQDGTNKRTDKYGGSIENRVRLPLEIVKAFTDVWGEGRVGVRISPSGEWGSISDSDPEATFGYYANELNHYNLAYLHIIEPRVKGTETLYEEQQPVAAGYLRKIYKGTIMAAGGFDKQGAEDILQKGDADLVAFGRWFASNPDLPERFKHNWALAKYNRDAFWGGNEKDYTDYPVFKKQD